MGIAKLAVLVVNIVFLLLAARLHGNPHPGKINFWVVLTAVVANVAILAAGGFFNGFINLV